MAQSAERLNEKENGLSVSFKAVINEERTGFATSSSVEIKDITGMELVMGCCALIESIIKGAGEDSKDVLLLDIDKGLTVLAIDPEMVHGKE